MWFPACQLTCMYVHARTEITDGHSIAFLGHEMQYTTSQSKHNPYSSFVHTCSSLLPHETQSTCPSLFWPQHAYGEWTHSIKIHTLNPLYNSFKVCTYPYALNMQLWCYRISIISCKEFPAELSRYFSFCWENNPLTGNPVATPHTPHSTLQLWSQGGTNKGSCTYVRTYRSGGIITTGMEWWDKRDCTSLICSTSRKIPESPTSSVTWYAHCCALHPVRQRDILPSPLLLQQASWTYRYMHTYVQVHTYARV